MLIACTSILSRDRLACLAPTIMQWCTLYVCVCVVYEYTECWLELDDDMHWALLDMSVLVVDILYSHHFSSHSNWTGHDGIPGS